MDCRKGPETKIFHPGLVNLSSNFHEMAAFNWLPDFRSNAPSSFTYDLYGQQSIPPISMVTIDKCASGTHNQRVLGSRDNDNCKIMAVSVALIVSSLSPYIYRVRSLGHEVNPNWRPMAWSPKLCQIQSTTRSFMFT